MIQLSHPTVEIQGEIDITGSKSESNRWLILQKCFPELEEIRNLSNAEDTEILSKALQNYQKSTEDKIINIHHAGTAMRFLTAYLATTENTDVILTGSERMQQRPIFPLVNALQELGCDIEYVEKEGFPPLKIKGKQIDKKEVNIVANVSSQYITALLLIAPKLPAGLKINFTTELTSLPYVEMTKKQLESIGIQIDWIENGISVLPKNQISTQEVIVESDWSSASYWYSMVALSQKGRIKLKSFRENSLQGDAEVAEIYQNYFGVKTEFNENEIVLTKIPDFTFPEVINLDLNKTPDIAQTIAVTCAGLQIKGKITGLSTLKIKETDRLVALQNELQKIGTKTQISDDALEIVSFSQAEKNPQIKTYQDHRMAMSFAPLALRFPLSFEDENVVVKSYPEFWQDLEKVGFRISR